MISQICSVWGEESLLMRVRFFCHPQIYSYQLNRCYFVNHITAVSKKQQQKYFPGEIAINNFFKRRGYQLDRIILEKKQKDQRPNN